MLLQNYMYLGNLKKIFDHKYFNGIASSSLPGKLRFKFALSNCCRSQIILKKLLNYYVH